MRYRLFLYYTAATLLGSTLAHAWSAQSILCDQPSSRRTLVSPALTKSKTYTSYEPDKHIRLFDYCDRHEIPNNVVGQDLELTLVGAKNLPIGSELQKSASPFVQVLLSQAFTYQGKPYDSRDNVIYETVVKHKTLEPIWNDKIVLRNVPSSAKIVFRIWHQKRLSDISEFLVEGAINMEKIPVNSRFAIPLGDEKTSPTSFTLKFGHKEVTKDTSLPTRRDGPIYWRRYSSKLAQTFSRGPGAIFKPDAYHVYDVDLHNSAKVFGNTLMHYNENYRPAKLFLSEKQDTSKVLRIGLHLQHKILNRGIKGEGGIIRTTRGFFELFNWGSYDRKSRRFTYIIHNGHLRFSQTGKDTGTDMLSKHMVLANGARQVQFAGEFFLNFKVPLVRKVGRDKPSESITGMDVTPYILDDSNLPQLVIDNSSGTYAPRKDMLPQLARLFQENFLGIKVLALNYDDEQLKSLRKANKIDT